jgi:hypothetical protein
VGRTQLAINIPAPLLERLRAAAAERGVTYSSLVLQWIEAGLGADLDASRSDLAARLDAVERRLDALPASPKRVKPAPRPAELVPTKQVAPPGTFLGAGPITTSSRARGAGPITTSELAELLSMRRGTLTPV